MIRRFLPVAVLTVAVAAADLWGGLQPLDDWFGDLRMAATSRAPTGSVVVVDIDAKSLAAIDQWPWPRGVHARVIDALAELGAGEIAIDVDFSTPSTPEEDAKLEAALERAGGSVILAAFAQRPTAAAGETGLSINRPIERFALHAWLATVNVRLDADGNVRRVPYADAMEGNVVPSIAAMFSGKSAAIGREFRVDFGIRADQIDRISLIDLIAGNVAPYRIAGKKVIVGAAALELRYFFYVPVDGVVSGALLQAIAAETLIQDRALARTGGAVSLLGLALIAALFAFGLRRFRLVTVVGALIVGAFTVEAAAILLQWVVPVALNTAPWQAAFGGLAILAMTREIDLRRLLLAISRLRSGNLQTILDRVVADNFAGVLIVDENGAICAASRVASTILGTESPLVGRMAPEVLPAALADAVSTAIANSKVGAGHQGILCETQHRRGGTDDRKLEYVVTLSCLGGGLDEEGQKAPDTFVACLTFSDVTERRRAEERVAYLARFDPLTGLPNRNQFAERLEEVAKTSRAEGKSCAVVCFDLDRFEAVNDTLGHDFGDLVLHAVGDRVSAMLLSGDLIARLGADEYAVILDGTVAEERARSLAEWLIASVSEPYQIDGHRLVVGMSVGIAVGGGSGGDALVLHRQANAALNRAKADGGNEWLAFDAAMLAGVAARQALECELWEAFERDEFEVWYQPQVDLRDGAIVGVEALLRWRHPKRGLISPAEFISVAAAVGLMELLGKRVLERACREVARWPVPVSLAVNLSTVQLTRGDLASAVTNALRQSELPPQQLELEITESLFIHESRAIQSTFAELSALGVRFALDDFGTGYSSLAYIRRFPVDKLKIDRSFVSAVPGDEEAVAIVRAVAALAQSLNISLNAEGIENFEQVAFLRLLGCHEGQGYLFGKAMPAVEMVRVLKSPRPRPDRLRA